MKAEFDIIHKETGKHIVGTVTFPEGLPDDEIDFFMRYFFEFDSKFFKLSGSVVYKDRDTNE